MVLILAPREWNLHFENGTEAMHDGGTDSSTNCPFTSILDNSVTPILEGPAKDNGNINVEAEDDVVKGQCWSQSITCVEQSEE